MSSPPTADASSAGRPAAMRVVLARTPHAATNAPAAALPFAVAASPPVDPAPPGPNFMTPEQAAERSSILRREDAAAIELTPAPFAGAPAEVSPSTLLTQPQRLHPQPAVPFTPVSPSTLHLDHGGVVQPPPAAIPPFHWGAAANTAERPPSHPSKEASAQSAVLSPVPQYTSASLKTTGSTPPRSSPSPLHHLKQIAAASPNGLHSAGLRSFMVSEPTGHIPPVAGTRIIDPVEVTVRDEGATQTEKDVGFAGSQALASAFGLSPPQPFQPLPQRQPPEPLALPEAVGTAALQAAPFSPQTHMQPRYPAGHVSFNVAPSYGSVVSGVTASQSNMAQMHKHMQQKLRQQQQQQQPMVAEEQPLDLNNFAAAIMHSEVNPLSAFVETNSQVGDITMFDEKPPSQLPVQQSVPAAIPLRTALPLADSSPISPLTPQTATTRLTGPVQQLSANPQQPQPQARNSMRASGRNQPALTQAEHLQQFPQLYPASTYAKRLARAPSHGQPADAADSASPRTNWIPQQYPDMHDLMLKQSDNHGINEQMGPAGVMLPGAAGPTFELDSTDSHGIDGKPKHRTSQLVPALPPQHHVVQVDAAPHDDDNSYLDDAPETDAFISGVPADQDVIKQQNNGGPNGRRRTLMQSDQQQQMQPGQTATAGGPAHAFSAPTTAGGPPAAEKFAAAQQTSFSSNLRFFKYLLLIGGLRQQTSSFYRWYIRITVWGCTLLCLANIFMRTKSFRNPFFDVTLVIMHFWVSYSFEKWHVFCKSHHWRLLVSIVSQSKTGNFFVHINQVGVFGLIATAGAVIMVSLGWIGPIVYESFVRYGTGGHYVFLTIHGVFMVLIILPWAAACICSSVLFHMVVLAHQSDVEHYFQTVKSLLITFADSQGSEALEETYGWLCRLHQPVRMRLRMTCHYFNSLYALAILVSVMLLCAAIFDFNDLIVRRNPVWHFIVQDAFFFGLGLVAMYGSLWVTSNLTNYWRRFVQRINELPQFLLTHPAAHNGLVNYFKTAEVAYTVYGAAVTPAFIRMIIGTAIKIMFVALIIYNWRYFPQQDGSIVLPPPDPPGP